MEEKFEKNIKREEESKLEWESPKLFCLDKGKTEGGYTAGTPEDTSMDTGS